MAYSPNSKNIHMAVADEEFLCPLCCEVFEEPKYCYLVMELLGGGELFDRIIEKKTFSENEARDCVQCVLSALEYMHERRVAHRDLKPENLLLAVSMVVTNLEFA